MTELQDFEVIADSEISGSEISDDNYVPYSDKIEVDSMEDQKSYSQDDKSFMYELYRENRFLLEKNHEKDKLICTLQERNTYLKNSSVFWLYCYFGIAFTGVLSLT